MLVETTHTVQQKSVIALLDTSEFNKGIVTVGADPRAHNRRTVLDVESDVKNRGVEEVREMMGHESGRKISDMEFSVCF